MRNITTLTYFQTIFFPSSAGRCISISLKAGFVYFFYSYLSKMLYKVKCPLIYHYLLSKHRYFGSYQSRQRKTVAKVMATQAFSSKVDWLVNYFSLYWQSQYIKKMHSHSLTTTAFTINFSIAFVDSGRFFDRLLNCSFFHFKGNCILCTKFKWDVMTTRYSS